MSENNEKEQVLDIFLRPVEWEKYIGQESVKENLRILVRAARERNQVPEHILLYGPPGVGKTTLAHLIGNELKTSVKTTSGAMIEKSGDIVSLLSSLNQGDILFIDEIHRLNKNIEEILYPIMESGSIDIIVGKGPSSRSVKIDLPPSTIIAATTQIGKISAPLRSRFSGGMLKLNYYSDDEIAKILKNSGKKLGEDISDETTKEIAKRSRKTPRTGNYLLKRIRDYAQVNNKKITKELVDEALKKRNIDSFGLTEEDRELLRIINEVFNGGPAGISAISAVMSEAQSTIEEVYEPFLMQIGFLERGQRGRQITEKGRKYLEE